MRGLELTPVRRLTARWHGDLPAVGAYLRSVGARTRFAYRILEVVDPQRSVAFADVWRVVLRCDRVPVGEVPVGAVVHPWRWDPRGRRRGR